MTRHLGSLHQARPVGRLGLRVHANPCLISVTAIASRAVALLLAPTPMASNIFPCSLLRAAEVSVQYIRSWSVREQQSSPALEGTSGAPRAGSTALAKRPDRSTNTRTSASVQPSRVESQLLEAEGQAALVERPARVGESDGGAAAVACVLLAQSPSRPRRPCPRTGSRARRYGGERGDVRDGGRETLLGPRQASTTRTVDSSTAPSRRGTFGDWAGARPTPDAAASSPRREPGAPERPRPRCRRVVTMRVGQRAGLRQGMRGCDVDLGSRPVGVLVSPRPRT